MAKIVINTKYFDGNDIDSPELSFKSYDAPLTKLFINLLEQMKGHKALLEPAFQGEKIFTKPEYVHPVPEKDIELDVIFVDNREVFDWWDVANGNALGFHAHTSGAYESEDKDFLSMKHRVVVLVSEDEYRNYIKQERNNEVDPSSSRYDIEYMNAYLTTLTHEIAHAVEFIEHTNGLPPAEVMNLREVSEIDLDLLDVSAGHGILFDFNPDLTNQEIADVMETRVEDKGRAWLSDVSLNANLIESVLTTYAPNTEAEQP